MSIGMTARHSWGTTEQIISGVIFTYNYIVYLRRRLLVLYSECSLEEWTGPSCEKKAMSYTDTHKVFLAEFSSTKLMNTGAANKTSLPTHYSTTQLQHYVKANVRANSLIIVECYVLYVRLSC